jgi:predicted flavoprotein YhiN
MTASKQSVAVVGGGPAGLFAAQRLAESGFAVTVYDRMPSVGRKLLLAGRGGLNLTHSEPLEAFLSRYGTDGAPPSTLILDAVRSFDANALRKWADDLGAETFVGTSGRVFPKALRATPLLRTWLRKLVELGVQFAGGWEFAGFTSSDSALRSGMGLVSESASMLVSDDSADPNGAGQVILKRVPSRCQVSQSDDDKNDEHLVLQGPVVLALGGASWPRLGADGSWASLFREAGVAVNDLRASNCGLRVTWSEHVTRFAGQPLKNVSLSINGATKRGELLIDPKGIEGSAAYAIGQAVAKARSLGIETIELDLRADVSEEHLAMRLATRTPKMSVSTWLSKSGGLTAQAIAVLRDVHGTILPNNARAMAAAIKRIPLKIDGTFPLDRAISTAGGVALSEVDSHFMLRSHPGVFVAGEMLDWDAPTGGYLLQACFATGSVAATGIIGYCGRTRSDQNRERHQRD